MDSEEICTSSSFKFEYSLQTLKITAMATATDGKVWCDCPKFHRFPITVRTRRRHRQAAGMVDTPDSPPIVHPNSYVRRKFEYANFEIRMSCANSYVRRKFEIANFENSYVWRKFEYANFEIRIFGENSIMRIFMINRGPRSECYRKFMGCS